MWHMLHARQLQHGSVAQHGTACRSRLTEALSCASTSLPHLRPASPSAPAPASCLLRLLLRCLPPASACCACSAACPSSCGSWCSLEGGRMTTTPFPRCTSPGACCACCACSAAAGSSAGSSSSESLPSLVFLPCQRAPATFLGMLDRPSPTRPCVRPSCSSGAPGGGAGRQAQQRAANEAALGV